MKINEWVWRVGSQLSRLDREEMYIKHGDRRSDLPMPKTNNVWRNVEKSEMKIIDCDKCSSLLPWLQGARIARKV